MNSRSRIATLAVAALVAACAPDEFRPSPGFDGFLDLIGQECYPDTIGPTLVRQWAQGYGPGGGGAGFMDATSSLYYGKMSPATYRASITAFTDNGAATNKAIDCIIRHLPANPPGTPGTGMPAGRDGVPPPPSR
ncbi:MAG: hypothetical protein ABWZ41_10845 [Burkholderiales bacterium]